MKLYNTHTPTLPLTSSYVLIKWNSFIWNQNNNKNKTRKNNKNYKRLKEIYFEIKEENMRERQKENVNKT